MTEAKLNEVYVSFVTELQEAGVDTERLVEFIGEERLKNSPAGLELSSGLAFRGALLLLMMTSLRYARQLVDMGDNEFKINPKSLTKVALLHHIGKAFIYEENDDEWQRNFNWSLTVGNKSYEGWIGDEFVTTDNYSFEQEMRN